jgi:hypothetical protein
LNINIGQPGEPEMPSVIVFKMPHVLIVSVQNTLNIKIEEIVSFGKDQLFKRQVTVSPVSPSRTNQRQTKHGSDDAAQNPCSSHVLVLQKEGREMFSRTQNKAGGFLSQFIGESCQKIYTVCADFVTSLPRDCNNPATSCT